MNKLHELTYIIESHLSQLCRKNRKNSEEMCSFFLYLYLISPDFPLLLSIFRFPCSAGFGNLHRCDCHFLWQTLLGLALFLVLHHWLGGRHSGFCSRYLMYFSYSILRLNTVFTVNCECQALKLLSTAWKSSDQCTAANFL